MTMQNQQLTQETSKPKEPSSSPRPTFDQLKSMVEAILFTADSPLEAGEIRAWIGEVSLSDVRMSLRALAMEYADRAFELVEQDGRYQIRTRSEHIPLIKRQYGGKPRQLSKTALETLAIIAYRQPITRAQINALRQVDSSSIVHTLKEKDLIYPSGTRKEAGNPIEFRTTAKFLEVFGLSSLRELPNLRSLQMNLDDQKRAQDALKAVADNAETAEPPTDIVYNTRHPDEQQNFT